MIRLFIDIPSKVTNPAFLNTPRRWHGIKCFGSQLRQYLQCVGATEVVNLTVYGPVGLGFEEDQRPVNHVTMHCTWTAEVLQVCVQRLLSYSIKVIVMLKI